MPLLIMFSNVRTLINFSVSSGREMVINFKSMLFKCNGSRPRGEVPTVGYHRRLSDMAPQPERAP